MTIQEYFEHYLKTKEGLLFALMTLAVIVFVVIVFYLIAAAGSSNRRRIREYAENAEKGMPEEADMTDRDRAAIRKAICRSRFETLTEEFYELIFAGGSILMFIAAYYLVDRFFMLEPYRGMWDKYKDYLLLLMIVLSILCSRIVDGALIRLKNVSKEDKAAIRLIAMIYMLLIFGYIKFIYENDNYDSFIEYFLGLMIGRFVYFDVSLRDFTEAVKKAFTKLPIMFVALACTGVLSLYGFTSGYLIKHIGVVTNVFFIHVFMTAAIFIVFHVYSAAMRISDRSKKEKRQ